MNHLLSSRNNRMPSADEALPGRQQSMPVPDSHLVTGNPLTPPCPVGLYQAMFGLGCFWGAEKKFWETPGIFATAVGYAAGFTPNPSYQEVCTGMTGHNEVVRVFFDPDVVDYWSLLAIFWEAHDPTQGMRQGNDVGTQYRSGIYVYDDLQSDLAVKSRQCYQSVLTAAGYGAVTTEIMMAPHFYYAEHYHQQYLAKNPSGYCGLGGLSIKLSELGMGAK